MTRAFSVPMFKALTKLNPAIDWVVYIPDRTARLDNNLTE